MWKDWKHQSDIVKAIPFLKKSRMIMAGDGLERRYMTSPTKCPPKYEGLWDAAKDSGRFKYKGLLPPDHLFKIYQNSRVMVDLSYSTTFNNLGNHFNRSIIEGYNNGVVPICVDQNMREVGMQRKLFKAGVTHFEVSPDTSPKELAELIDYAAHLKEDDAMEMITKGRRILSRFFDYRKSSLDFLKLAEQEPCGVYPELERGSVNAAIKEARLLKLDGKPHATIKAALVRHEKQNAK
jgi:hypothetical protein